MPSFAGVASGLGQLGSQYGTAVQNAQKVNRDQTTQNNDFSLRYAQYLLNKQRLESDIDQRETPEETRKGNFMFGQASAIQAHRLRMEEIREQSRTKPERFNDAQGSGLKAYLQDHPEDAAAVPGGIASVSDDPNEKWDLEFRGGRLYRAVKGADRPFSAEVKEQLAIKRYQALHSGASDQQALAEIQRVDEEVQQLKIGLDKAIIAFRQAQRAGDRLLMAQTLVNVRLGWNNILARQSILGISSAEGEEDLAKKMGMEDLLGLLKSPSAQIGQPTGLDATSTSQPPLPNKPVLEHNATMPDGRIVQHLSKVWEAAEKRGMSRDEATKIVQNSKDVFLVDDVGVLK